MTRLGEDQADPRGPQGGIKYLSRQMRAVVSSTYLSALGAAVPVSLPSPPCGLMTANRRIYQSIESPKEWGETPASSPSLALKILPRPQEYINSRT
jgi:hypothetical protein